LANSLLTGRRPIGIVDADVGQSSLGPPTTIGLAVVAEPFQNLQELPTASLFFVGSTSPREHTIPTLVGTKRLLECAQKMGVEQVIIDTCGYVSLGEGQSLKYHQIELVSPEVVVCLQRARECESILLAFRGRQRPHIIRLRASHACRRRSTEERRRHRRRALQRFLADPKQVTLSWDELSLVGAPIGGGTALADWRDGSEGYLKTPEVLWAERRADELYLVLQTHLSADVMAALARTTAGRIRTWLVEDLHGTLLGLLDGTGAAVGIGILTHIDFASHCFGVYTARGIAAVHGVHWSRMRLGQQGDLQSVRLRP
jgi:polynucleotide 5'-hydroxyl-kinase GRC3/NOL9